MFNKSSNSIVVLAPIDGNIKNIKEVSDPVFNSGIIGKGIAIIPSSNAIYPVFDGELIVSFHSGHAYGIQHKNGPQVLIHIGVDTVELNGKGFKKADIPQGSKIKTTQKLVDIDFKVLEENGKSTDIIIVVTNETIGDYKITKCSTGQIKTGEPLFYLQK